VQLARHPGWSHEVDREEALGVVGWVGERETGGGDLLLNGHIDVVPAGDEAAWSARRAVRAAHTPDEHVRLAELEAAGTHARAQATRFYGAD